MDLENVRLLEFICIRLCTPESLFNFFYMGLQRSAYMAQSRWTHDANTHACEVNSSQRQHALSFIVITHIRWCWAPPESAAIGPVMWTCMCWPVLLAPSYNFIEVMCSCVSRRQAFRWQQKTCVLAVPHNTVVVATHEDMYMMRRCTQSCLGPITPIPFFDITKLCDVRCAYETWVDCSL